MGRRSCRVCPPRSACILSSPSSGTFPGVSLGVFTINQGLVEAKRAESTMKIARNGSLEWCLPTHARPPPAHMDHGRAFVPFSASVSILSSRSSGISFFFVVFFFFFFFTLVTQMVLES